MDKFVGKRLDGRYEIREIIGIGGMAVVYKAYDSIEDRIVAIKILKDEFASNEEFQRRFKNESKAIAVLSHPNIVKVYDVSFGDLIQYIVMEYIEGITLKELIERNGNLEWNDAINFTIQILRGLQHAHDKGIVHRDVKPQNIIVLADKTIKVTDFGIARFARKESQTITDKAIGSVHYISPEQAKGELTDEKADIYSLGVIMYEMLTGTLPFEAESAVSVAIMQLQAEPKLPTHINPLIPMGLEQITMKAMQKDTMNRYKSAAEMLRDLEMFKRDPSIVFQNTYFVDNSPTKHLESFYVDNNIPTPESIGKELEYQSNAEVEEDNGKVPVFAILAGVSITFVAAIIVLLIIFLPKLLSGTTESFKCPDFRGKTITQLEKYKEQYNFTFIEEHGKAEGADAGKYKPGQIYAQNPEAGSQVKKGAAITISIQEPEELIDIPELKNIPAQKARERLETLGFKVVEETEYHESVEKGSVIRTVPGATSSRAKGAEITIVVSLGKVPKYAKVPDVEGLSEANAIETLKLSGFTVERVEVIDNLNAGYVIEQSHKSDGTLLDTSTPIVLKVGSGSIKLVFDVKVPADYKSDTGYITAWIEQDKSYPTSIDGVVVPEENSTAKIDFTKNKKISFTVAAKQEVVDIIVKISDDDRNHEEYLVYRNVDVISGKFGEPEVLEYTKKEVTSTPTDTTSSQ